MKGMDEKPNKASEPLDRKRWRLPWLLSGTLAGIAIGFFLLLMTSDSSGRAQMTIIVVCPILGLGAGLLIDTA